MLLKLARMGVPPRFLHWYKNFMNDRSAQVAWQDATSERRTFASGVAQGTCSGPVLFNALVSDCPVDLQFADDAAIVCSAKTLEECTRLTQEKVSKLQAWVDLWRLPLNLDKTTQSVFGIPDR